MSNFMATPEAYMTTPEAAKALNRPTKTINKLVAKGFRDRPPTQAY